MIEQKKGLYAKYEDKYIIIFYNQKGLTNLFFADSWQKFIGKNHKLEDIANSKEETTKQWLKGILDFLLLKQKLPEIPYDISNTSRFRQETLNQLAQTKAGTTLTYSELATKIGNNKAYRAVATACAQNPIPIVIPCHRVLPKQGGIGKFLYGPKLKKQLLEIEQNQI